MLKRINAGVWIAQAVALMATTATAPAAAQAVACGNAPIGVRFAEAAKLCGRSYAPSSKAESTLAESVSVRVTVPDLSLPVSVSMPGYRRGDAAVPRRAVAARLSRTTPNDALLVAVGQRYRIDPQFLASIMTAESAGRQTAISPKGALGLMQVMPATARSVGVREPRKMLSDRALALSAGAAYLKHLQRQFGNNLALVAAAYNAGPGAVRKYRGIPRYRETQTYVGRVMSRYAATRSGPAPR